MDPSGSRTSGPITPAVERSPASFTNADSVPAEIEASGLSTKTNGESVARIPWFTAVANPRLSAFSITWIPECASVAASELPSEETLSTTTRLTSA